MGGGQSWLLESMRQRALQKFSRVRRRFRVDSLSHELFLGNSFPGLGEELLNGLHGFAPFNPGFRVVDDRRQVSDR